MKRDQLSQTGAVRRNFIKASSVALAGSSAIMGVLGSSASHAGGRKSSGQVPVLNNREPTPLQGAVADMDPMMSRRLHLVNEHTGDDYDVVYYTHGIYVHENLSRLNHLMRDRRDNVSAQMDTTLYDQLFLLREELGTNEPIHVLSGYRTQKTNDKLRKRSKGGVASRSLHIEARAADIYVPGFSPKKIQKTAIELAAGGVGIYSRSNFVHIDTGNVRYWGS